MVNGSLYRLPTESQKKKQNQDDSDDDDDDEAGPSFQQPAAQPQAAYAPPMTQAGMPPVPAAPGMPPGSYAGTVHTLLCPGHVKPTPLECIMLSIMVQAVEVIG